MILTLGCHLKGSLATSGCSGAMADSPYRREQYCKWQRRPLSRGGLCSVPVVRRRGWWRFISCPSTLETVYLSWLARPRKWWCRLTDVEWDVREPLRTTNSLAVTTLSVPTCKICTLHIHAERHGALTMAFDLRLRALGYGSRLPRFGAVSLGKTLYLYVGSVDPGVNGCLVGQWVLVSLNSFQRCCGSRAVCSPGNWGGTGTNRPYNQGKLMWSS